jgi:antitoxin YefM
MNRINLEQDIRPLSDFRSNAAALIKQLHATRRPLVLTQRGQSAVVVLGVREYERLLEEMELLRDVHAAEQELEAGGGLSHEEALTQIRSRLGG